MCTKQGAIPFADLGKQIAQNWKALSTEERSKYAAEASVDKERYAREVEESNAALQASQEEDQATKQQQYQSQQQQPGPKIRNKRLGDGVVGGGAAPDAKRRMMNYPYEGYETGHHLEQYHPSSGPSPRGPPPYYDPYFGYGRPPPPPPGGEGYGPPPPMGTFLLDHDVFCP